jgi:hypothetical protein
MRAQEFTQGVAEGRVMHRDFKSWANHAKSQGLKVRKSSNPIEWSNDAIDKEGNIRGRFVGSNIPQNSRGFIHQQDVAEEQLDELTFMGSQCTKDCSGHRAGYNWSISKGRKSAASWSNSFNKGAELAATGH